MIGFGLCVVGAFVASYYQALEGTASLVNGVVNSFTAADIPTVFYTSVASQMDGYISQNITPSWETGLLVGVVIAIAGVALVARGDGKPPAFPPSARRIQPITTGQRD